MEFDTIPESKVLELDRRFESICDELRPSYDYLDSDPYLCVADKERRVALVKRFLLSEKLDVDKAAERLRSTIMFRRDWNVKEYHEPGAAAKLIPETNNPGAEIYFADSLQTDAENRPYLVGRIGMLNLDNMHPWRHLRAGVFMVERMCLKLQPGQQACYILDGRPTDFRASYSATGGRAATAPPPRRATAGKEGRDAPAALVAMYGELSPGLPVLRAALGIMTAHYPELLHCVVFYEADLLFRAAYAVFSLWLDSRTRRKLIFAGRGFGCAPPERLRAMFGPELCPEFGGGGPSLDGDTFIRRAVEACP